ncbi:unnamed protein product [Brachionus calyciflorus]|uniref:FYVE-type domain-containing protein n=1 Tax=Brachionus calyciflorus TaxID=104777 RepID=A0A814F4G5_9BILA|nr:unnamed protein product [Brachionus calyciflorus]
MATIIKDSRDNSRERKPILIDRIDGIDSDVLAASLLPNEDGFISINDDRSIRIWLKRDTGKYWPSVCHYSDRIPSCLFHQPDSRRLFVGLDSGNILEFAVGEDYNKITLIKQYLAHTGRVTSVYNTVEHDWVLSTSKDKYFAFHSTDNSRRIGSYSINCTSTCVIYDTASQHCFIGDENGKITFLKLTDNGCEFKATLNGHESSISCLSWDAGRKFLFSGSYDKTIICWDIGGQKGTTYDLEGHRDRVQALVFVTLTRQLISGSEDGFIVIWDMDAKRKENPQWKESDFCEYCKIPFIWNIRGMWKQRTMGKRQHHCRRCGAAICDNCSQSRASIPILGHEFEVRICSQCEPKITNDEKIPLAQFHDSKHSILDISYDEKRKYLLTVGFDRIIKVWDMNSILA